MIRFLVQKFIPDCDNIRDRQVRKSYGVLGGMLGILCNTLLFVLKLGVGMAINSIAVISDAFNNLSDMGSSLVSVIGARVSGKLPDADHPYGHGRAEYISALIVSFIIMLFGLELFRDSVSKILTPEHLSTNFLTVSLLVLSVLIKLWMWHYNRFMGKKINSSLLLAAAKDSLNDVIATVAVILAAIAAPYLPIPIDGIMGLAVSVLIAFTGFGIAKDTIDKLLGRCPSEDLRQHIEAMVLSGKNVLGMHDLMVHDYGPGRIIASVHAEVPDHLSLIEVHTTIDQIEHQILAQLNVDIVIHMDPVPALPENCADFPQ